MVKKLPAMQETQVQSLSWEDPLEKGLATPSSILARSIPWTEELGGLQSTGSQRTLHSVQSLSCVQLCDPMDCSTPGLPVHHQLLEFTQTHVHRVSVMPSSHLILCCPLLLLPSVFPSIEVFSRESALHIRWPKY